MLLKLCCKLERSLYLLLSRLRMPLLPTTCMRTDRRFLLPPSAEVFGEHCLFRAEFKCGLPVCQRRGDFLRACPSRLHEELAVVLSSMYSPMGLDTWLLRFILSDG